MENYPGGRMPENQNSRTNDSMRPRPLNHEYSCANDVMRPVTQLIFLTSTPAMALVLPTSC